MQGGEINEVSEAIGGLTATVKIILDNQRKREDVDGTFRRDMRDALAKLASTDDLKKVNDDLEKVSSMATATKTRVDRAGWHLSGIMTVLSLLMIIIQNKVREWLG